jgi:hypothetical protein
MFRWIALASAVVFVVAFVGVIVSGSSMPPSQQIQSAENKGEHRNKEGNKTLWDTWFPDSLSLYTLALVVFTAVLAFGGLYQLRALERAELISAEAANAAKDSADAAKKAVELSDKTAERQLRAYIYIDEAHMVSHGDNEFWRAQVVFKNFGQTPAYGVVTPTDFYRSVSSTTYDFQEPPADLSLTPNDWGPGQKISVFAKSDQAFTKEEADRFRNESWVIFIQGVIKYKDAFGNERRTNFRLKYHPDGTFDTHGDGNKSD